MQFIEQLKNLFEILVGLLGNVQQKLKTEQVK